MAVTGLELALSDADAPAVETLANLRTARASSTARRWRADRIRYRRHDGKVFLYAFDLIELDGDDLRREPLDVRKATLRSLLVKVGSGRPAQLATTLAAKGRLST